MITVRLMGGLGNQLFQYAAAYSIAKQRNLKLALDKRFFDINKQHGGYRLDKLKIPNLSVISVDQEKAEWKIKTINKVPSLGWLIDASIIHESKYKNAEAVQDDSLLLGYWQNHQYFFNHLADLKEFFAPIKLSSKASTEVEMIKQSSSVSLHIRRGDYVSNPVALRTHGICSMDYYKKAINHMLGVVEAPTFFVFSDDIPWVEKNLSQLLDKKECFFIKGNSQEEDLWLMSNARHHVIANSSFSWWGAYLASSKEQIVISPSPWFDVPQVYTADPSLSEWIRIVK